MLPHVMRQGSDDSPNKEIQARCKEMEAQGALSASVFVGFPNADIEYAGLSAVVVTDGDEALARRWCDEIVTDVPMHRLLDPLEQHMLEAARLYFLRHSGSYPMENLQTRVYVLINSATFTMVRFISHLPCPPRTRIFSGRLAANSSKR